MSATTTDRLPLRVPDVTVEQRDDGHLLRRPGRNTAHLLNETALALWQLCDGETTPREMADAVVGLFGLDHDTAEREVDRTLAELTEVGLITWSEGVDDGATEADTPSGTSDASSSTPETRTEP